MQFIYRLSKILGHISVLFIILKRLHLNSELNKLGCHFCEFSWVHLFPDSSLALLDVCRSLQCLVPHAQGLLYARLVLSCLSWISNPYQVHLLWKFSAMCLWYSRIQTSSFKDCCCFVVDYCIPTIRVEKAQLIQWVSARGECLQTPRVKVQCWGVKEIA